MTKSSEHTNFELEGMAEALQPLLDRNDIIGYVAARNFRLITDAIAEYLSVKESLLKEHGRELLDEDGNGTGRFSVGPQDEGYEEFMASFSEVANVRHEIGFYTVPAERCVGVLTGRQFLDVEFMVEQE